MFTPIFLQLFCCRRSFGLCMRVYVSHGLQVEVRVRPALRRTIYDLQKHTRRNIHATAYCCHSYWNADHLCLPAKPSSVLTVACMIYDRMIAHSREHLSQINTYHTLVPYAMLRATATPTRKHREDIFFLWKPAPAYMATRISVCEHCTLYGVDLLVRTGDPLKETRLLAVLCVLVGLGLTAVRVYCRAKALGADILKMKESWSRGRTDVRKPLCTLETNRVFFGQANKIPGTYPRIYVNCGGGGTPRARRGYE